MSRLVARQWRTLASTLALRPSLPSACRVRGAWAASAHSHAPKQKLGQSEQSNHDTASFPAVRPLNSVILIPSSIKDTKPDDLITHINPISPGDATKNTFCVCLVTPSFAPWLLKNADFLAQAIARIYGPAVTEDKPSIDVQVLSAVVDKLPAGKAVNMKGTLSHELVRRATEPPDGDAGFEGIAFLTLPADCSVPSTSMKHPEKGAIDFTVSAGGLFSSVTTLAPLGALDYVDTWRLPLANTIFHTGTAYTMFLSEYRISASDDAPVLTSKIAVSHHGINTIAANDTAHIAPSTALRIPLLPLTPPRRVEEHMGNIIRSVKGPDKRPRTASSELEEIVPRFFKARNEPAQPTTAWALVIPGRNMKAHRYLTRNFVAKFLGRKETDVDVLNTLYERMWQAGNRSMNRLVPIGLAEGARLHRILSGGGGWGKKAGLLSLDPVPMSEEMPIRMEDATSAADGPGDFPAALNPVVQEGDAIQFFIASSPSTASQDDSSSAAKLLALPKKNMWGWELGTVPSTVDALPGGSWQHASSDSPFVAVFRHVFGALSEGGLTLTRRKQGSTETSLPAIHTTTIDVPFTRVWTVETGATVSAQNTESPLTSRAKAAVIHDPVDKGYDQLRRLFGTAQNSDLTRTSSKVREPSQCEQSTQTREKELSKIPRNPTIRKPFVAASHQPIYDTDAAITAKRVKILIAQLKHFKKRFFDIVSLSQEHKSKLLSNPEQEEQFRAVRKGLFSRIYDATHGLELLIHIHRKEYDSIAWPRVANAIRIKAVTSQASRQVNEVATAIYNLHISLRTQLGNMFFIRQNRPKRKGIRRVLTAHLTALRKWNKVLFYNQPRITRAVVRKLLRQRGRRGDSSRLSWMDQPRRRRKSARKSPTELLKLRTNPKLSSNPGQKQRTKPVRRRRRVVVRKCRTSASEPVRSRRRAIVRKYHTSAAEPRYVRKIRNWRYRQVASSPRRRSVSRIQLKQARKAELAKAVSSWLG